MRQKRQLSSIVAGTFTAIIGLVLLIWASFSIRETLNIRNSWLQLYSLSIFSTTIAAILIILSIGFIYVVIRQFPALTTVFSGLLSVFGVFAILCVILLVTGRINFKEKTYNTTLQVFANYSDSDQLTSSKSVVQYIQQTFECCGVKNATDWINQYTDGKSTPDSCCKSPVPGCGRNALDYQERIFLRGCAQPFTDYLQRRYNILIGLNLILALFAFLSTILGIAYEHYIRNQYQLM